MARLIDAVMVKDMLREEIQSGGTKTDHFDKGYDEGLRASMEMIDNTPTVEMPLTLGDLSYEDIENFKIIWQRATSKGLSVLNLNERPHGEWITTTKDGGISYQFFCSSCYKEVQVITDYCPNCGAYMRKEGKS